MKRYIVPGSTFLFQGDSVTDCGRVRGDDSSLGDGYPAIFAELYGKIWEDGGVKFVNRGVSGDTIVELLKRYEEDFVKVAPDYLSIMIGVNDTWRNFDSGAHETDKEFEERYEKLLTQIKRDLPKTKIILIEQFCCTAWNDRMVMGQEDLDCKRAVTRRLAEKYADVFVPMYDIIIEHASQPDTPKEYLLMDGVHPTKAGHTLIALELAKSLEII